MSPELIAGVIGALAGALASFWLNTVQDWWKIRRISSKLRLVPDTRTGSRVTARVMNDSNYPVRGAVAYVTVDHRLDDVLPPPLHFAAYVSPAHLKQVVEDRLCWSAIGLGHNRMAIDIYAGEHQCLDLLDLGATGAWIEIPSEIGYSSSQTRDQALQQGTISSRVFLRTGRKYRAQVRLVSADTRARVFTMEVDTADQHAPVTLLR